MLDGVTTRSNEYKECSLRAAFDRLCCLKNSGSDDEDNDIDWNNLGFSAKPTDYMYVTKCLADGIFERGQLNPYGNIELNPFAAVLNYGQ
ncbi:hypothetical protein LOK49_LG01G00893, partial [Camellia lanceoleosa]